MRWKADEKKLITCFSGSSSDGINKNGNVSQLFGSDNENSILSALRASHNSESIEPNFRRQRVFGWIVVDTLMPRIHSEAIANMRSTQQSQRRSGNAIFSLFDTQIQCRFVRV